MRNFTIYLLGAQSERSGSDARWKVETFDDFLPELLVDYIDEPASRNYQVVQLVEVQYRFRHNGKPIDRLSCNHNNKIDSVSFVNVLHIDCYAEIVNTRIWSIRILAFLEFSYNAISCVRYI